MARWFALILLAALSVSVVAAEEETTTADEFTITKPTEPFLASERTDIIPAGVAAIKKHEAPAPEALAQVRFQQTEEAAVAQAAHIAEMEVEKSKKRIRWPPSPDHPGKSRGCWITQTHCIRHPDKWVGTFRDTWGEKNVGSGKNEKKCLARAQEYHVYCGNPHTVSTTAKFRNTQRQRSYPNNGCWIHQSVCNRDSTWTGVFRDAWGEKKLGTGNDEKRCLQRAREYAVWCGNPRSVSTMAEFRSSGNTRYHPHRTGCFISQDVCTNHPNTVSPWPFRDVYGEKNVASGTKELNCHARAREYHAWCGNSQSDSTVAEFRSTGRRSTYPAIDKVQVDQTYAKAKVSWKSSENYCKAKGKGLCMRSELCPNGFPLRGRPRGDHWVAVRDMENGWVSIGTQYNERVCKYHQEVDNGQYGKPTWGFDKFDHPVLCCDDPDEVVWAKNLALANNIKWSDAKKACEKQGLLLCPHSVYCPQGPGNAPNGGITGGDHWAPTSDYPNAWVSVGEYDAARRICRLHDSMFGFPSWGTQRSSYNFKGHVRCCTRNDACSSAPCANGGKCIAGADDTFTCKCKKGFQGKTCDVVNKCSRKPCKNGGECQALGSTGDYECHCKAGFSGKNCERNDPCSNDPCRNNAKCINDKKAKGGFRCKCRAGFSGRTCGVRNPCASNPCKNKAKCIRDSETEFHCKCVRGFNGKLCGHNIDDCTPAAIRSCKNGGKCVDGINEYRCDCAGTKFAGPSCTQYPLTGWAQVLNSGELFIDDDSREDDLGTNEIKIKTYALPGSVFEISAKAKDGNGGIVASFEFRGTKMVTGDDWECSTDDGKTYRRARSQASRSTLPPNVKENAKFIWARDPDAPAVTCRVRIPMKNLASGTRIVLPVKHKIAPLCARATGSTTFYYGEVCANGGIQWNHMHTSDRRAGLKQSQCAWSRRAMSDNPTFIANWFGSCTQPPKMLFPKLPTSRASYYVRATVETDPCKSNPCAIKARCEITPNGPMPFSCKCARGYSGDGSECVEVDNCAKNPCDPNATCRRTGPGQHICTCKHGFMGNGNTCTEINSCQATPPPCSPRATCRKTGPGTHICTCKKGYAGDGKKCKAINSCRKRPFPCHKNAVCAPTGPATHRCTCKTGYKGDGKKCEEINACLTKPCHRNAECFKTGPNKYRCECKKGYKGTGKECTEVNMCKASRPCHSAATCTFKGPGKYACACNRGWEGNGKNCIELDMCKNSKPCDQNALCSKTGPGTYSCKCRDGFTGDGKHCAEINICETKNPCSPLARCKKSGPGVATCKCRRGYEGDGLKCRPINKCHTNPCDPHAKCKMTGPGQYRCTCNKGWSGNGKVCKEYNKCKEKPCDTHAKCTKTGPGTFKCACQEGFKGDGFVCVEINDCDAPGICNENAACMKTGAGKHKCTCKRGYRGDGIHCTEINPCLDTPCDKKATCTKTGPGKFDCKCFPGYQGTGKVCKPINLCKQRPCDPRAKCSFTGPATYKCTCPKGYRGDGKRCKEIESCKERPCPPNSVCLRTGPGRHRCKCNSGYTWDHKVKACKPVNGCQSGKRQCSPNAICEPTGPGTVKCTCRVGYEGDGRDCRPINTCKTGPCGQTESCVSTGPGIHKCVCKKGHSRVSNKVCRPINRCKTANPKKPICAAGATCVSTGPGSFKCACAPGFKFDKSSKKCTEILACASNPCSKWATCTKTTPGQFKCACRTGFAGDGIRCSVQPGSKAILVGGKVQIVPLVKGDSHDQDLSVIEAMLGKMAGEEPNAVAKAFGGSAASIGAGGAANPTPPGPTAEDISRLEAVRRRVVGLEQTTSQLADAARRETEELRKLREQSAKENERVLQVLQTKADSLLDKVTDQTQEIMAHTPHAEGHHKATMNIGFSKQD